MENLSKQIKETEVILKNIGILESLIADTRNKAMIEKELSSIAKLLTNKAPKETTISYFQILLERHKSTITKAKSSIEACKNYCNSLTALTKAEKECNESAQSLRKQEKLYKRAKFVSKLTLSLYPKNKDKFKKLNQMRSAHKQNESKRDDLQKIHSELKDNILHQDHPKLIGSYNRSDDSMINYCLPKITLNQSLQILSNEEIDKILFDLHRETSFLNAFPQDESNLDKALNSALSIKDKTIEAGVDAINIVGPHVQKAGNFTLNTVGQGLGLAFKGVTTLTGAILKAAF